MTSLIPARTHDVAALLGGVFPGHTMQRVRTPDGKYRYSYVSAEVQAAFGLNADTLMETDAVDHSWIHQEDRARFIAALEHSAAHLSPLDEEVRVLLPAGGHKWVRSLGQPRRLTDQTVVWDGVALDVTDRREALLALERALSDAKRNEVSEGRFAAIATQDVVRPLDELGASIRALDQIGATAPPELAARLRDVVDRFDDFTKALTATRELVQAVPGQQDRDEAEVSTAVRNLTPRQLEIMKLVHRGASNQEIAQTLGIKIGTVKLHISAILKRANARNRTEASKLCFG